MSLYGFPFFSLNVFYNCFDWICSAKLAIFGVRVADYRPKGSRFESLT